MFILFCHYKQGRPQDFGLGGAKSLARSAKKKIRAKREKNSKFCPPKINFLPYYFLVWKYFSGAMPPPPNQLGGGHGPLCPPPLWTPLAETYVK